MRDIPGLIITEVSPRDVDGIASFAKIEATTASLQTSLAIAPPVTSGFVQSGDVTLSCIAPKTWLAAAPRGTGLAARLAKDLAGLAAITDQSDQHIFFSIAGPAALETLSRVVPINLDAFAPGGVALTRAGHIHVRLWSIAAQSYEISVARSYGEDLIHALT